MERWQGETDIHMLGERGGRWTIDRQTDVLGRQREREKEHDRQREERGRQTGVMGDGSEIDD